MKYTYRSTDTNTLPGYIKQANTYATARLALRLYGENTLLSGYVKAAKNNIETIIIPRAITNEIKRVLGYTI